MHIDYCLFHVCMRFLKVCTVKMFDLTYSLSIIALAVIWRLISICYLELKTPADLSFYSSSVLKLIHDCSCASARVHPNRYVINNQTCIGVYI